MNGNLNTSKAGLILREGRKFDASRLPPLPPPTKYFKKNYLIST